MLKALDKFEEYVLLILFPAMVAVVFTATVARYFNLFPMYWGEELARYIMVYLAYTGAGLGMKWGSHISVGFLVEKLSAKSAKLRLAFDILQIVMVLVFTVTIVLLMRDIIGRQMTMQQTSPAMYIPMWMLYAAVPYGMILVSIRAIQAFVLSFRNRG